MKDALGHGSNGGWGAHPGDPYLKSAAKYTSLNGRKDAVVRTERMADGYLWQHGSQYGYANSVGDAKATVESRVADEARANTHAASPRVPFQPHELEATQLRSGSYVVRPKGSLGTMGWHPRAWTMASTKARSPEEAIRKVGHKV